MYENLEETNILINVFFDIFYDTHLGRRGGLVPVWAGGWERNMKEYLLI